jgi:ubiquinone/menaquinone biosynthesis C-methylase UbiE
MNDHGSTFGLYALGLRLGLLHLLRGKIRRGVYLLIRPLDYWRTREFPVTLEYLQPQRGEHILDVGSPKLISMYVATRCGANVYAMDIYDDNGLTDTMFYKSSAGIDTLHVLMTDVRELPFADSSLDKVFSVSVLEHVLPAEGGDVKALKEIARVLQPAGRLVFTVPFAQQARVDYLETDGMDRTRITTGDAVFFQRRYDAQSLRKLLADADEFEVERQEYICEKFSDRPQKELWTKIGEGNKFKRLALAPLYPVFALIFLKRSPAPLPGSGAMAVCMSLRKKNRTTTP